MTEPVSHPPVPAKRQRPPIRAWLSQIHQRTVLFIRYLFRVPMDDVRDGQFQQMLESQNQIAGALRTLVPAFEHLRARVDWYEKNILTIKKEKAKFDIHWKKYQREEKARRDQFNELVKNGVSEVEARERIWPTPKPSEDPEPRIIRGAMG